MKIAVLLDHDPRLLNGASRQGGQFVDWLLGHGHEIHLVHTSSGVEHAGTTPGLRVTTVPSFPVKGYRGYRIPLPPLALRCWLSRPDVDLVHAETMNPTLLALGYWMKRRARVPMFNVLTANLPYYTGLLLPRDNVARKLAYRLGKPLMNAISNRLEGTLVLSEGMRASLTRNFFSIDPARVFTWTRPLDPAVFDARREPSPIWDALGVPRGHRLATLSRLCPTKNIEFLVRAFARYISPADPALHLVIAGEGPHEATLRRLAADLGCPRIRFPGVVAYGAVPAFLGEADYFLYASQSETFGNVICEAKYAGVPIVALDDDGGVRSQIADGRTGVLVGPRDERAFAGRFLDLRHDRALQDAIRRQARLDVVSRHSPARVYGNLLRVYEALVRGEPLDGPGIGRLLSAAGPRPDPSTSS